MPALGVAGRYILTPGVFHEIATQQRGVGGEIKSPAGFVLVRAAVGAVIRTAVGTVRRA